MVERFREFKANRLVLQDPLAMWCIRPGCGKILRVHDRYQRRNDCRNCLTTICFLCRREWHGETDCDDVQLVKTLKELKPFENAEEVKGQPQDPAAAINPAGEKAEKDKPLPDKKAAGAAAGS